MKCEKHPTYQGMSKPRVDCKQCWQIYHEKETDSLKYQLRYFKHVAKEEKKKRYSEEDFIEAVKTVLSVKRPLKALPRKEYDGLHQKQEAVMLFGDCQLGEKIDKQETGYRDYCVEVFKERLKILYESCLKIINRHRKDCEIPNLNILMLGDIVEGRDIFRGQANRLDVNVADQVFTGQELIANFIRSLSRYFDNIKVRTVIGNHGRVGRFREELSYVNWDYVVYRNIEQILSNIKNVDIDVKKKWWEIVDIEGWKFYMEHGDKIKKYMQIPWYGMKRADNNSTKMLKAMKLSYDYFVMGHHHTPFEWDSPDGERFCNGTFSSGNPYAMHELKVMTRPTQKIFGVHKDRGITWRYNVRLDE